MRTAPLHATQGFELSARLTDTPHGHHLQFLSHVPSARRPEWQVRYQTLLSREQLMALRNLIDAQLSSLAPADISKRSGASQRREDSKRLAP